MKIIPLWSVIKWLVVFTKACRTICKCVIRWLKGYWPWPGAAGHFARSNSWGILMHSEHTLGNMPKASAVWPSKTNVHTCEGWRKRKKKKKGAAITDYMFVWSICTLQTHCYCRRKQPYTTGTFLLALKTEWASSQQGMKGCNLTIGYKMTVEYLDLALPGTMPQICGIIRRPRSETAFAATTFC